MDLMGRRWIVGCRAILVSSAVALVSLLGACSPVATVPPPEPPCDDAVELAANLPPALVSRGIDAAVGSGDTWLLPPSQGKWAQDVRWFGGEYFLKIGVWTLSTHAPVITVRQIGNALARGTSSSSPTGEGLPGPLPTTLRFPAPGCWDVTAQGVNGSAHVRIFFDTSARDRT